MYMLTNLALRADPNPCTNTTRNTIVLNPTSARMALVVWFGEACLWVGRLVVRYWQLPSSSSAVGGFQQMVV
jgi:hypothetical protein